MKTFKDFGLSDFIIKALDALKFTQPTEIQEQAIPLLLQKDVIDFHGQAQTGTGKTLAFGLPLLHKIDQKNSGTQALIVAPTRELVLQICQSLKSAAQFSSISIEPIYGGVSLQDQMGMLKRGVQIIVGTPGRLNDHLRRSTLSLAKLNTLVLDEADIMLDMGFREEIDDILARAPKTRNIWLFSATVKDGITQLAKEHMRNPEVVRVSRKTVGSESVKQYYCVVPMKNRIDALCRIIDSSSQFYGFIFCATKINASEIAEWLLRRGYKANALHGDMSQAARNRTIRRFKDREFSILVATDVAARGIDVPDITHVVNFRIPEDQESYVHRIGRTGRAGNVGVAITFLAPSEVYRVKQLERKFQVKVAQMNIPTVEDIATIRVQEAGEYLTRVCHEHKDKKHMAYRQQLRTLVQDYAHEDLVNAMVNALDDIFFKYIKKEEQTFIPATESKFDERGGSDDRSNRSRRGRSEGRGFSSRGRRSDGDFQEICLNVGSDDGVTKRDVELFLRTHANVEAKDLGKLKVIKRFVFLDIPRAMTSRVIQSVEGKNLGGRTVRVRKEQRNN